MTAAIATIGLEITPLQKIYKSKRILLLYHISTRCQTKLFDIIRHLAQLSKVHADYNIHILLCSLHVLS